LWEAKPQGELLKVLLVAQNTRGRKNSPPAIRLYATWLQCLVEYIFRYVVCLSEKEMGPSFALRTSILVHVIYLVYRGI